MTSQAGPLGEPREKAGQARPASAWRSTTAAALLTAAVIAWSAFPLGAGGRGTRVALIAAVVAGLLGVAQLVVISVPPLRSADLSTILERNADRLLGFIRGAPWAEIAVVAVLALEALHPARPWHTGLLGVALLGYLLAVHLAETRARPAVLRAQLPVIAAGIGLLALAIGATTLPGLGAGQAGTTVRIIAIVAAVAAAGLAVPVNGSKRR
jgi:hypothetical protein